MREMIGHCIRVSELVALQYIGFDFTLDAKEGPMLLEINARPGLEIQKANKKGLMEVLS
jgi:D-alanine-D-alanine ligase-like ATP-grasp enzyme